MNPAAIFPPSSWPTLAGPPPCQHGQTIQHAQADTSRLPPLQVNHPQMFENNKKNTRNRTTINRRPDAKPNLTSHARRHTRPPQVVHGGTEHRGKQGNQRRRAESREQGTARGTSFLNTNGSKNEAGQVSSINNFIQSHDIVMFEGCCRIATTCTWTKVKYTGFKKGSHNASNKAPRTRISGIVLTTRT